MEVGELGNNTRSQPEFVMRVVYVVVQLQQVFEQEGEGDEGEVSVDEMERSEGSDGQCAVGAGAA